MMKLSKEGLGQVFRVLFGAVCAFFFLKEGWSTPVVVILSTLILAVLQLRATLLQIIKHQQEIVKLIGWMVPIMVKPTADKKMLDLLDQLKGKLQSV
jgi:VIT1/CCC1 family predicted Fe2+/Mn2+ transporter